MLHRLGGRSHHAGACSKGGRRVSPPHGPAPVGALPSARAGCNWDTRQVPIDNPHRPEGRPPTRHFGLGSRSHHAGAGPWEGRRVGVLPSARAGCKRGTRRVPVASLLRPEGRPPTSTSGLGAGYPCCIGLGASPWERLRSSISPNLSPTTGFSPAAYLIHSPAHPLTPSFHVYFTS
jgi:hypothetical protein